MEGRKDQLVDEDVMETASVAPPEPEEEKKGADAFKSGEERESGEARESGSPPEPVIRPSPD